MPDSIPHLLERAAAQWAHYRRSMLWPALAAAVAAALSILHLVRSGGAMPPGLATALIAGLGLSVLTVTAIRGLVFLARRHEEQGRDGGER